LRIALSEQLPSLSTRRDIQVTVSGSTVPDRISPYYYDMDLNIGVRLLNSITCSFNSLRTKLTYAASGEH